MGQSLPATGCILLAPRVTKGARLHMLSFFLACFGHMQQVIRRTTVIQSCFRAARNVRRGRQGQTHLAPATSKMGPRKLSSRNRPDVSVATPISAHRTASYGSTHTHDTGM